MKKANDVRMLERVKKLLRLSESPHPAEAAAALAKVAELCVEMGWDAAAIDGNTPETVEDYCNGRRQTRALSWIHLILRMHLGIEIDYANRYDAGGGYTYIGPREYISLGKHIEEYLTRLHKRCWDEHRDKNLRRVRKTMRERREDYCDGFFGGVLYVLSKLPLRPEYYRERVRTWKRDMKKLEQERSDDAPQKEAKNTRRRRKPVSDEWCIGNDAGRSARLNRPIACGGAQAAIGGY